jgi:FkbM family methyltransferase
VAAVWTHPENRGRRLASLARLAAWQVWERTVRRPKTVGLVNRFRVRCYPHSPITSAVIYYGLADHQEMRFLLRYLRPEDEFVDVGANAGIYTLLALSIEGTRALMLEPSGEAHRRAAENIGLNGLEARVTLLKIAAGKKAEQAQLTVGLDAMNALTGGEAGTEETETVEVDTLDNLVREHGYGSVALMKLDVEGWEMEALDGAAGLFGTQRPALIVEVNDAEGLERFASRFGYTRVTYDPATRAVSPATSPPANGYNAILVPDLEAARGRLQADS